MITELSPNVEPSKPELSSNSIENNVQLEPSTDGEVLINDPGKR